MKTWVSLVTAILLVVMGLVVAAPAEEVVGRLTQVEGRVDMLKGGQLPANPAKLQDPVALGDVIRTKSLSKASITFVDNTVITVSPESRIVIEEYMFDPSKGKRSAVLQLFYGTALAVVSKIFKTEQPDFVIKTHTAIMGVRGTEIGVRLSPNDSTFLNFEGLTRVASNFPEISGDLFKKAAKIALSFDKGYVDLGNMQAATVTRGMPPTLPYSITKEDREVFMRQMVVSTLPGGGKGSVCSPTSNTCNPGAASTSQDASSNAAANAANGTGSGTPTVLVVPVIAPPAPAPSAVNLTFSNLVFSNLSGWVNAPGSQPTTATFNINSGPASSFTASLGSGSASFSLPTSITLANTSFLATTTSMPPSYNVYWNNGLQVTYNNNSVPANVTLTGLSGGPLTGTLGLTLNAYNNTNNIPSQTFTIQGTVTFANGTLTYNSLSGTFITVNASGLPSGTVGLPILAAAPVNGAAASLASPQLTRAFLTDARKGYKQVMLVKR